LQKSLNPSANPTKNPNPSPKGVTQIEVTFLPESPNNTNYHINEIAEIPPQQQFECTLTMSAVIML
jgi:hypothetical protein